MTEEEKALDTIWRNKIKAKIEGNIKRHQDEIEQLEARLAKLDEGEPLPFIDRNQYNQFVWYCPTCKKMVGKNILLTNIPFKKDSYCKDCSEKTSHDLTEMMS